MNGSPQLRRGQEAAPHARGSTQSLRVSTASWGTTPHAQESACAIRCASTWVLGPPRTLAGPVGPDALTHVDTHAPRITRAPRAHGGPPDTKAVQTHRRRGRPARTGVNPIPQRPPHTDGGLPNRPVLHQRRPEAAPHARGSTAKWGPGADQHRGTPRTHGGLPDLSLHKALGYMNSPDARGSTDCALPS